MNDLTQALAELRQMELTYGQLWTAREVMQTQNADDCKTIATILNAVLSGEMIPRADHDLAVVMVVGKAAERCDEHARHEVGREAAMLKSHAAYFRAFDPTDALAELQALRDSAAESEGNLAHALHQLDQAKSENNTLRAQVERLTGALKAMPKKVAAVTLDDGPKSLSKDNLGAWVDGLDACEKVVQRAVDAALTEGAVPVRGYWKDFCREQSANDVCDEPCTRCKARAEGSVP